MRKFTLTLAMVLGFLAVSSAQAAMTIELQISQGGPAQTFLATSNNLVSVFGVVVGDYRITGTIADSNNPGTPADAFMDLTNFTVTRVTSNSAAPLIVLASDIGFTMPVPFGASNLGALSASYTSNFTQSSAGDKTSYDSWLNADNTIFSTAGTSPGAQTYTSTGVNTTSGALQTGVVDAPYAIPFGITTKGSIDMAVGSQLQTTSTVTLMAVPEPATVGLAFSAIAIMGLGYWRRRTLA
jgi:hypothetical protein